MNSACPRQKKEARLLKFDFLCFHRNPLQSTLAFLVELFKGNVFYSGFALPTVEC